jgi:hypothetical protein
MQIKKAVTRLPRLMLWVSVGCFKHPNGYGLLSSKKKLRKSIDQLDHYQLPNGKRDTRR